MIEVGRPGSAREIEVPTQQGLPATLPVLPLRDTVTFPETLVPLAVGQERSMALINDALGGDRLIAMVASRDPEIEAPSPENLYEVGVAGVVARMLKVPDGTLRILVQATQRIRVTGFAQTAPYLVAQVEELPDISTTETPELLALVRNVQATFTNIVEQVPYLPEELHVAVANLDEPGALSHLIAGALRLRTEEKQALLEERDVAKRLRRLSEVLARELEVDALELPEEVRKQVDRELARLERLPPAAAEHGVIRGYLEWIASMPWSERTEDNLNLRHARRVLDEDHYDIEQVKDRILEFLAVRKLIAGREDGAGPARSSILCLVGPPGVGKTSIGRSIARALGRRFERISVGGVRDEAEIRGHRRTYIGAMPGVIVRALRDAGTRNPLFMIDEIDKMGADFRGDPASAMLEVLDPEQNATFRDHYLDLPFDLSGVMFVTTANTLETIPGPLRDRMEVIQLAGYTEEEKLEIARRYLVPRQIERNGLTARQIAFGDAALKVVIAEYTREAGVRGLERELGSICRKVARQVAEGRARRKITISAARARELLGKRRVFGETRRRTSEPGVATGLAWTPAGGDVLFVEATAMPGTGKLTITGQLGDVMKESAQAALSYVRSHRVGGVASLPDDWFAR